MCYGRRNVANEYVIAVHGSEFSRRNKAREFIGSDRLIVYQCSVKTFSEKHRLITMDRANKYFKNKESAGNQVIQD